MIIRKSETKKMRSCRHIIIIHIYIKSLHVMYPCNCMSIMKALDSYECRISYEILAIQLGYLYCKFDGATLHHQRPAVHSIFQISISRITKCAHKVGFHKSGHVVMHMYMISVLPVYNIYCIQNYCTCIHIASYFEFD